MGSSGFQFIDASVPTTLVLADLVPTSGYAHSAVFSGAYCFGADETGVKILDVTDLDVVREVAHRDTGGIATGVDLQHSLLYVGDYHYGLQIVDIAHPTAAEEISSSPVGDLTSMAPFGDIVFGARAGFFDMSDVTNPVSLGTLETDSAWVAEVSAGYVLFARNELWVYDVADPAAPVHVSTTTLPDQSWDILTYGDLLFVAADYEGVHLYDVSQPSTLTHVGSLSTPGRAFGLDLRYPYLYIADRNGGLHVADVTDPENSVIVKSFSTGDNVNTVQVVGDYAYVSNGGDGVGIYDLNASEGSLPVGSYTTPDWNYDVEMRAGYVFALQDRMHILDVTDPTAPRLVRMVDNPYGDYMASYGKYFLAGWGIRAVDLMP